MPTEINLRQIKQSGATSNQAMVWNGTGWVPLSVVIPTEAQTLTNKRINKRIIDAANYVTNTGTSLDATNCDLFTITAQAGALLFNNPTGTAVQGQELLIRIKDNGTARALTYGGQFRGSSDLALPATTIVNRTLYMKFIFNSADTRWDLLAFLNNFAA